MPTIQIKQKHFGGMYSDIFNCPLASALKEKYGYSDRTHVGCIRGYVNGEPIRFNYDEYDFIEDHNKLDKDVHPETVIRELEITFVTKQ